jgi:PIN domain nuclease of toxin-antitoxin system
LNFLLDTHLLVWVSNSSKYLSKEATALIQDKENVFWFSTASLWEAAIKAALKRPDFPVDVGELRAGLLANGFNELDVEGRHIMVFKDLPLIHKDPFDRMLVAQAKADGFNLLTVDALLLQYGNNIQYVPRGR